MSATTPFVVVDDDPTGTQTMAGVRVLLGLDREVLQAAASRPWPAVHLMTNSRAAAPEVAKRLVRDACEAAAAFWPDAEYVLRGDSTLRGHLVEEYDAVREIRFPGREPVLLLAPALPEAGRITVDGVHLLARDGARQPLHDTEYARDPALGYPDAHLLRWAEHRSAGRFAAADGLHVPLADLRADGTDAVLERLRRLAASGAAVCATDAETVEDLRAVADAFLAARAEDLPVVLRCAPTLAGILSGATADGPAALPPPGPGGVLLVCGSFVPTTTRQLAAVARAHPDTVVEPDLAALVDPSLREVQRCAAAVAARLAATGFAVLATPRPDIAAPGGREDQERVADRMARVVASLPVAPATLVTKGGVTSAVTIAAGLGALAADVVGPVAPGVGRWDVITGAGRSMSCLVVPGNVGDDRLLVDLVDALLAPPAARA
ncbi:four-carbon acid sugar kinase family protein [Egicoccus sp. AB-alg6-2]|uniref:four-carbon acid sugar kinase family protein n=1 Tax=Egicoccus sp. AB-alg6-2 TaxID=3242692 RepID=UPI00359D4F33